MFVWAHHQRLTSHSPRADGCQAGGGIVLNRNDYRRALLMLRSLKTGVSGYVRLERRTLMGTLQFTVNGAPVGTDLYAILLHRTNGGSV